LVHSSQANELLAKLASDPDPQVRIAAFRALAMTGVSDDVASAIVAAWPKLDDDFQRSAAVGVATKNAPATISAALGSSDPTALAPLVGPLTQYIADRTTRRPPPRSWCCGRQTGECRRVETQHSGVLGSRSSLPRK